MSTTLDIWIYRPGIDAGLSTRSIVGYAVEALDGSIGKVDAATYDVSASYMVVDTGPWIFGKKVVLPAGIIRSVDHDDQKVFVHRTQDEIKDAPDSTGRWKGTPSIVTAWAATTGPVARASGPGTTARERLDGVSEGDGRLVLRRLPRLEQQLVGVRPARCEGVVADAANAARLPDAV